MSKNRQHSHILSYIIAILFLFSTACVSTPEKEAVNYQGQDLLERIEYVENGLQTTFPSQLVTPETSLLDELTIQYDAAVEAPSSGPVAIDRVVRHTFTGQEIYHMTEVLFPAEKYCGIPYSKAYFATLLEQYKALCTASGQEPEDSMLQYYQAQIQEAPEQAETLPFSLDAFRNEAGWTCSGRNPDGTYAVLYGNHEENSLYFVRTENTTVFRQSNFDPDLEEDQAMLPYFHRDFCDSAQLLPSADELLAELGFQDLTLSGAEPVILLNGPIVKEYGWEFSFAHSCGLIPPIDNDLSFAYGGDTAPVPTLCSPFGVERISITISENGELLRFSSNSYADRMGTEATNVKLCALDTIVENINSYLRMTYAYSATMLDQSSILVDGLHLCSVMVSVKDHFGEGRLIPAWLVQYRYGFTASGQYGNGQQEDVETIYFNALDGTYIEPRLTATAFMADDGETP